MQATILASSSSRYVLRLLISTHQLTCCSYIGLQNTFSLVRYLGGETFLFVVQGEKRQPYDEDIRVPLIVRGPKVPSNTKTNALALNIDLVRKLVIRNGNICSIVPVLGLMNNKIVSNMAYQVFIYSSETQQF